MQVSKSLYSRNNKNVFSKNKNAIVRTYSFFQSCISIEACNFLQSWRKCSDESKSLYSGATVVMEAQ
jgi:hypothetical protein